MKSSGVAGSPQFRTHRGVDRRQPPRRIEPWQLRRLWGLWKKLSMNLTSEEDERTLRLGYTGKILRSVQNDTPADSGSPPAIASWSDLTRSEAGRLIAAMKRDLGPDAVQPKVSPAGRGIIAALAVELFGGEWDRLLHLRIEARFRVGRIDRLTPHQVQELAEELLSRIAHRDLRRHGAPYYGGLEIPGDALKEKIEEVRERFMPEGGWPSGWGKK